MSKRLNVDRLLDYKFALPPLEEQKRIFYALKNIDYVLESLLDVFKRSVNLQNAFIVHKLRVLSQNNPNILLSDIAEVQYGLTVNSERRKVTLQSPYLRVANVQRGSLDLSEIKTIGKIKGDENFILQPNDLLIVEGHADPNEVGRAAIWIDKNTEMLHQNHLIRIRCKSNIIPQYLCAFINSPLGRQYFKSYAKSTSGLNTLNSTVVRQLKVVLPPISEQKKLVEVLKESNKAIQNTLKRRKDLQIIRQTILTKIEGS